MDGEEVSRSFFFILMFLLFFSLVMLSLSACSSTGAGNEMLCFGDRCFLLERANTVEEREIGLMNRTALAENEGMFFVFEKDGFYPFWMKNTLIPLDMIWLDADLHVVQIISAEPCTADSCRVYDPGVAARYVIELKNGTAETMQLKVGDSFQKIS